MRLFLSRFPGTQGVFRRRSQRKLDCERVFSGVDMAKSAITIRTGQWFRVRPVKGSVQKKNLRYLSRFWF